jgi:hypothetical protein
MMDDPRKSDRPEVPVKSPSKAGLPAAEGMEGRGLAKGNSPEQNASRTPGRSDVRGALERVRQAARRDRTAKVGTDVVAVASETSVNIAVDREQKPRALPHNRCRSGKFCRSSACSRQRLSWVQSCLSGTWCRGRAAGRLGSDRYRISNLSRTGSRSLDR